MERKYDMRICSCGRIHMIPWEKVDKALEADKNLAYICGGCGKIHVIGADIEPDWNDPNKTCYNMYSFDINQNEIHDTIEITPEAFTTGILDMKPFSEMFYSVGLKVPMMTGEYARSYFGDYFCDMWYPDWYKIQRKDITVKEIMEFIEKFTKDQRTVNMSRFIHDTPDDMLEEISHYYIKAFDWKGTKFEKEFH